MAIEFQKRIDITCAYCGSRNVKRDAAVTWSVPDQAWEISSIFDNADCEDCGGETSLQERDLATGEVIGDITL
jgi:hypothetical protein